MAIPPRHTCIRTPPSNPLPLPLPSSTCHVGRANGHRTGSRWGVGGGGGGLTTPFSSSRCDLCAHTWPPDASRAVPHLTRRAPHRPPSTNPVFSPIISCNAGVEHLPLRPHLDHIVPFPILFSRICQSF